MKLFKFRSIKYQQEMNTITRIIVENEVGTSLSSEWNDPREGFWNPVEHMTTGLSDHADDYHRDCNSLTEIIDTSRSTSFCSEFNHPLMWGHYAQGYRGLAIMFDVEEGNNSYTLAPITYSDHAPNITWENMREILSGVSNIWDHGILATKIEVWQYEKEYRLFPQDRTLEFISLKPSGVIFGMPEWTEAKRSENEKTVRRLCREQNIKMYHQNRYDGVGLENLSELRDH